MIKKNNKSTTLIEDKVGVLVYIKYNDKTIKGKIDEFGNGDAEIDYMDKSKFNQSFPIFNLNLKESPAAIT